MNNKKTIIVWFVSVIGISVSVLFSISSVSCKISPEAIQMIGGDYTTPELRDLCVTNNSTLNISFSKAVTIDQLKICPADSTPEEFYSSSVNVENVVENSIIVNGENVFEYEINHNLQILCSQQYLVYGLVEDKKGNTLSFSTIITGYNDRVPMILLSECRTEWSKPKAEFIEFFVLSDGNTGGMILEIAYNNSPCYYVFPAIEVKAGEYFVLHLRSIEDGTIDELTESVDIAFATEAFNDVRDLWLQKATKTIGKTGAIVLRQRQSGPIVDALLYAESSKTTWPYTILAEYAQESILDCVWSGDGSVTNVVNSDGLTVTRTLSRQNIPTIFEQYHSNPTEFIYPILVEKEDWFVVATSNCTLGKENSSVKYSR